MPSTTPVLALDGSSSDSETSPPVEVDSSNQSSKDQWPLQPEICDIAVAKAAKRLQDRGIPIVEYGEQLQFRFGNPAVLQARSIDQSFSLAAVIP
jgi:hypothetical protein